LESILFVFLLPVFLRRNRWYPFFIVSEGGFVLESLHFSPLHLPLFRPGFPPSPASSSSVYMFGHSSPLHYFALPPFLYNRPLYELS